MFKSLSIFLGVAAVAIVAIHGMPQINIPQLPVLETLPIPFLPLLSSIPSLLSLPASNLYLPAAVTSVTGPLLNGALNFGFAGVSTKDPLGTGDLSVGGMTLPVNVICSDTSVTNLVTCHACFADCLAAHNKWGGECQFNSEANAQRCTCYEGNWKTNSSGTFTNATQVCGPLEGGVDPQIDQALQITFRVRYALLQCSQPIQALTGADPSTGCNDDCTLNHQYISNSTVTGYGVCAVQQPVNTTSPATAPQQFCTCGFVPAGTAVPTATYAPSAYSYTPLLSG